MWKRVRSILSMKIPGDIWAPALTGALLGITGVLFITLPNKDRKRRRVTSESNWRNYYGSCPELKEDVARFGKESFRRTILSLHTTVGKTNYEETRQLFINNVLIESLTDGTPAFYNSNILGRYYRKDYFTYDC